MCSPAATPSTTLDSLLALGPRTIVPAHGDPAGPEFVAGQRAELAEVAALHAAVARGTLPAAEAARRSPYPDVPWPAAAEKRRPTTWRH